MSNLSNLPDDYPVAHALDRSLDLTADIPTDAAPTADPWRPITALWWCAVVTAWCCTPAVVVAVWKWGWG